MSVHYSARNRVLANYDIVKNIISQANFIRIQRTPDMGHYERFIDLALVCRYWYYIVKHELCKSLVVEPKKSKSGKLVWRSNLPAILAAGMQHKVIHLCLSGPLVSERLTVIEALRGLGIHSYVFPNLGSILMMNCSGYEAHPRLSEICRTVAGWLVRIFPYVKMVTTMADKLPLVPSGIYLYLTMLLAKSIPDVTLNGSVLGEFPMVHFQNLVKIRITNSFEAPQTETLRINSQTLRTVEILNSTGAFPWGIFGDADKPIEFPNVEQMLICTRTGQQLRQRTQIKRFQLRFPKLSNIILIGAMDMYTDVLELTRFPKVTSVGILDNVEKLKSIDPRIIRRLTKFHFGESQEDRVTVLPSDCFFVKIFDVPSPVTNALLALPYFDFPQIKKVRWSKLANLMLSVNSMSLETIELLMLQLPRMHSLNISMIKSDPKAAGDAVCSRKTPLSKTLGDMYFIIAEPTLRDEAWVEMVVQRLPALFRLTVQEYFKRTDERLRQSYKNGLAYA